MISNNAFIKSTGMFHVCPVLQNLDEGPLHIHVDGMNGTSGKVVCEQMKLIDPSRRRFSKKDRISYMQLMNVSDAIQGIFEYD